MVELVEFLMMRMENLVDLAEEEEPEEEEPEEEEEEVMEEEEEEERPRTVRLAQVVVVGHTVLMALMGLSPFILQIITATASSQSPQISLYLSQQPSLSILPKHPTLSQPSAALSPTIISP
jgi:cytoskeletal protein RodZ